MSKTLLRYWSRFALAMCLVSIAVTFTGCGGGMMNNATSTTTTTPAGSTAMTVKVGDAPADSVVAFEITVTNITLTDSNNNMVTVLSSPQRIELSHNSATLEPVAVMNVPQGTYTQATVTVSNPEVDIVNGSGQVVELTSTLASSTAIVTFNPSLTVGTTPVSLNFDFNVAASLAISGSTATITPTFTAASATVMNEAEQDDDNGQIEDFTGTVSSVSAPTFSVTSNSSTQAMTFTTDANTQFEGVTGVSGLQSNMVVQVDAVTQMDGTFLATKVEVEEANAEGLEAEGIVSSTAGMPSSFLLVIQDESSSGASAPAPGSLVTVNVSSSTQFKIHDSDKIDLSGLSITPTFDVTTLAPAQAVEADTDTSNSTSITANTLRLDLEALVGTVSNFTQIDSSHASFTLTPATDSAFDSLSTQTALTVLTTDKTELKDISGISNGATLRVRGLLFFNGGAYTMVAARVTTP